MDDLRFNKFFRSLGEKYWDCVSDEKIAEQFAVANAHFRPVSPVFRQYCARRIDLATTKNLVERWTAIGKQQEAEWRKSAKNGVQS